MDVEPCGFLIVQSIDLVCVCSMSLPTFISKKNGKAISVTDREGL
jgi:hypothetical protein